MELIIGIVWKIDRGGLYKVSVNVPNDVVCQLPGGAESVSNAGEIFKN